MNLGRFGGGVWGLEGGRGSGCVVRPSKAEDESRRARKYENTKGVGISAVENFSWLMGGIGAGLRRSRRRDRPRAEDESRRARKYENTKGGGDQRGGDLRSRGRRRPFGCARPAPNEELFVVRRRGAGGGDLRSGGRRRSFGCARPAPNEELFVVRGRGVAAHRLPWQLPKGARVPGMHEGAPFGLAAPKRNCRKAPMRLSYTQL